MIELRWRGRRRRPDICHPSHPPELEQNFGDRTNRAAQHAGRCWIEKPAHGVKTPDRAGDYLEQGQSLLLGADRFIRLVGSHLPGMGFVLSTRKLRIVIGGEFRQRRRYRLVESEPMRATGHEDPRMLARLPIWSAVMLDCRSQLPIEDAHADP